LASRRPASDNVSSVITAFARAPYLVAGVLSASIAVFWMPPTRPLLQYMAPSAGWVADAAIMAPVFGFVTMLVAAVGFVAHDRLVELKSRKDWAAIAVAANDLVTPPIVLASDEGRRFHQSAVEDEALWAILRTNHSAARLDGRLSQTRSDAVVEVTSATSVGTRHCRTRRRHLFQTRRGPRRTLPGRRASPLTGRFCK
jgi:hypothetical protein